MSEQSVADASSSSTSPEDAVSRGDGGTANWLLVEGNRLIIAGVVVAAVLAVLIALVWSFGFAAVRPASPMYFLFSSLVTGDLTLVTVVLSINQLVLSRELGSPGTLTERIRGAVEYREEVEESTDVAVSPKSPARFLRFLHGEVESEAHRVEDAATDVTDESLRERLGALTDSLFDDVSSVSRSLEADEGIFTVVRATIMTNHASQLQDVAAIKREFEDSLTEELSGALDGLETHLLQIDVARNYFKTVYVQKELAYLSRILLYVGVPAIVVDGLALVFYNLLGPASVSPPVTYAVVGFAVTAGFAPLSILFAFVLRLAWVAQRTATVAPFASDRYR